MREKNLVRVLVCLLMFGVAVSATARPPGGKRGFGRLQGDTTLDADGQPSWLKHHYDNRTADFVGAAIFDDSAEVEFTGRIAGLGAVTVEQSAAWTFTTYALEGGTGPTGPCAVVYDTSRDLDEIHTHAGVTTDRAGAVVVPPLGLTHTFPGTVTITKRNGRVITGVILGGSNCEVKFIPDVTHGIYMTPHTDTENTVTTVFDITGGTRRFTRGVLTFTYDTGEPHGLHDASITLY